MGLKNKRVRGQESRTGEGKGKVKGGRLGSILVKEHPIVIEIEAWKGAGTERCHSNGENGFPVDHVAGGLQRMADSLLRRSKAREIVRSTAHEKHSADERGEGSLREVNRHK